MIEKIVILDFGSQYTQLIARRVRELNVYCEIYPYHKEIDWTDPSIRGAILSGSPFSTLDESSPTIDLDAISGNVPVLAVCYSDAVVGRNHNKLLCESIEVGDFHI